MTRIRDPIHGPVELPSCRGEVLHTFNLSVKQQRTAEGAET